MTQAPLSTPPMKPDAEFCAHQFVLLQRLAMNFEAVELELIRAPERAHDRGYC